MYIWTIESVKVHTNTGIQIQQWTNYLSYLFSLGSMVQKGKFSAGAEALVRTLKKVDFLWKYNNVNARYCLHLQTLKHFSSWEAFYCSVLLCCFLPPLTNEIWQVDKSWIIIIICPSWVGTTASTVIRKCILYFTRSNLVMWIDQVNEARKRLRCTWNRGGKHRCALI